MYDAIAFYVFAAGAILAGVGVLLARDIIRAVACLLGTLAAVAGLYLLLSAPFLAAVQLILYAGGVVVLVAFGVMLTTGSRRESPRAARRELVLATAIAPLVAVALVGLSAPWRVASAAGAAQPGVAEIGAALLTRYWLPFQLLSVLLLAVMIGAAHMARPRKF